MLPQINLKKDCKNCTHSCSYFDEITQDNPIWCCINETRKYVGDLDSDNPACVFFDNNEER